MDFCSLSSGSSGNSSLLKTEKYKILIDAGLSLRRIEKGFAAMALDPANVDYLFLTHAHGDHSKSIYLFATKYKVPVYMTRETYRSYIRREARAENSIKICFFDEDVFLLDDLKISIFRLPHTGVYLDGKDDAGGNIGFLFEHFMLEKNIRLAYLTDLGEMPELLYAKLAGSDFYFIESNHDIGWQKSSRRPAQVIERNLSSFGHLSNEQTGSILTRLITRENAERKCQVMLAHLSSECNSHILAMKTIKTILQDGGISGIELKIAPEKALSEYVRLE